MTTSRKAFEAWANEMGLILKRFDDGYAHSAGHAWIAWQAARYQALEDAALVAHEAWENGGGSESSGLPNAIRELKEE